MTHDDLMSMATATFSECYDIMKKKNADYSGGGGPFENFAAGEVIGIDAELGILLRCMDKFQRIRSFATKGKLEVENESVDDAISDVINYMVLLKGVIRMKKECGSLRGTP